MIKANQNLKQKILIAILWVAFLPIMAKEKTLLYWSVWNEPEPQAIALKQIFSQFSKANPNIKIKAIWNGRQSLVKLRSYLAAGKTVDIIDADGDQFLGLVTKEDLVLDLSKDLKSMQSSFLPGTFNLMKIKGKQYGVPYILNALLFFYSKGAFEDAGITEPNTWDDFLAMCRSLKKSDYDPLAIEGNVDFYQVWYFTGLMQRMGGSQFLLKIARDKSGKSWNDPRIKKVIQMEKAMLDAGCVPKESDAYQYPAAQNNIADGLTAVELVGSWLPTELAKAVDDDFRWGSFAFPKIRGGMNKNELALVPMILALYQKTKMKKEAIELIKFILSQKSMRIMSEIGYVGVPIKKVAWPKDVAPVLEVLKKSTGAYLSDGGMTAFMPEYIKKVVNPNHTKFMFGKLTTDAFLDELKKAHRAYWKSH